MLQFFKFENLVLLMQVANSSIDFKVGTDKNVVDLKTTLNFIKSNITKSERLSESFLVPYEFSHIKPLRFQDELVLGKLPEFCPEAFMPLQATSGVGGGSILAERKLKKQTFNMNILTEP